MQPPEPALQHGTLVGYSVQYRELPPLPDEDAVLQGLGGLGGLGVVADMAEPELDVVTVQADPGPEPFVVLSGLRAFTRYTLELQYFQ